MKGERIKDTKGVTREKLMWGCPLPPRRICVFAVGNFTSTRVPAGHAAIEKRARLQSSHFQKRLFAFFIPFAPREGKAGFTEQGLRHIVSGQTAHF